MTTVLVVRHGETDFNQQGIYQGRLDVPLNSRGEEQARKLGSWLQDRFPITHVYSSPLRRARSTAEAILGYQPECTLHLEDELQEIDVGEWEGLSGCEAKDAHPEIWERLQSDKLYTRRPEGESYWDLYRRVSLCLDRIVARHGDETICLTSHGGCVRVILAHVMGVPPTTFSFLSGLQVDNAGLTILKHGPQAGRWAVAGINLSCHLF